MRHLVLTTLLGFLCLGVFAQRDFGLQGMQNTYQKRYLNPAFQPDSRVHVGLPVLSSTSFSAFNTGFKLGGIFDFNDESNDVDTDQLISELEAINTLGYGVNTDFFTLGVASGKNYISLSTRLRVDVNFNYPGDFMQLILEGNGGNLLGERINMDNLGIDVDAYIENGLGFSRQITDKLTVGVTAKYLIGLFDITTERSQLGLTTDRETYSLNLDGALDFRLSGLDLDGLGDGITDSTREAAIDNLGVNSGFGFDLGATYDINDKISVGAAILDIGSINWSEETSNIYQTNDVNFEYSGFDYDDFIDGDNDGDFISEVLDSLQNELEPDKRKEGYTSQLNTQIVLTGSYKLTPKTQVGVMYRNLSKQQAGASSMTAYASTDLKRWLSATVSASYMNRSIANVGAGLMLKGGPVQFYAMADNLYAIVSPETTRNVHARFGINLVFGKTDASEPEVMDGTNPANPEDQDVDRFKTKKQKRKERKEAKEKEKQEKAKRKAEAEAAKEEATEEESGLEYVTPKELKERKAKEKGKDANENTDEQPEPEAAKELEAAPKKAVKEATEEKASEKTAEPKAPTAKESKKKEADKAAKKKAEKKKKDKKKKKKKDEEEFDNWNEPKEE